MPTATAPLPLWRHLVDSDVLRAAPEETYQAFLAWLDAEGLGQRHIVSVAFTDDRSSALVVRYRLNGDGHRYSADGHTAASEGGSRRPVARQLVGRRCWEGRRSRARTC